MYQRDGIKKEEMIEGKGAKRDHKKRIIEEETKENMDGVLS